MTPIDINGQLLSVGDCVIMRGKIAAVMPQDQNICNIQFRCDEPLAPHAGEHIISLSGSMVEKRVGNAELVI